MKYSECKYFSLQKALWIDGETTALGSYLLYTVNQEQAVELNQEQYCE